SFAVSAKNQPGPILISVSTHVEPDTVIIHINNGFTYQFTSPCYRQFHQKLIERKATESESSKWKATLQTFAMYVANLKSIDSGRVQNGRISIQLLKIG